MVILYYATMAGIVWLFHRKKVKFLRFILGDGMTRFCKKYWQKMIAVTSMIVILFCAFGVIPHDLKIYFVDVGQRRLLCHKKPNGQKYYNRWRK